MSALRRSLAASLCVAGSFLIVVTVLPLFESNEWWVRIWDFPRAQIAAAGLLVLPALLLASSRIGRSTRAIAVLLAAATLWQGISMLPYTPLGGVDVASITEPEAGDCVGVLVANVYMENQRHAAVRETIEREDPDIVFVVENDRRWSAALEPLIERYPHVLDEPLDNTYGLLFMTRLDVDRMQLRHLVDDSIPSVRARLRLPSGDPFTFYGVHPKPPRVAQDTDQRDLELTLVAREIRGSGERSIVGGDLNDVAWSHTTRLFLRISEMLDPRRGRGLYASFHAENPLLRWPLDHVFATPEFAIERLDVLGFTGSDHFPVVARFCLGAEGRGANERPEGLDAEDREDMRETVDP